MSPRQRPRSPHAVVAPGSHGHPHLHGQGCLRQGDSSDSWAALWSSGMVGGRAAPGTLSNQNDRRRIWGPATCFCHPDLTSHFVLGVQAALLPPGWSGVLCEVPLRALALGRQGIKQLFVLTVASCPVKGVGGLVWPGHLSQFPSALWVTQRHCRGCLLRGALLSSAGRESLSCVRRDACGPGATAEPPCSRSAQSSLGWQHTEAGTSLSSWPAHSVWRVPGQAGLCNKTLFSRTESQAVVAPL